MSRFLDLYSCLSSLFVPENSTAQGTTSTCICLCHLSWRPLLCSSRTWFSTSLVRWTTAPQALWVWLLIYVFVHLFVFGKKNSKWKPLKLTNYVLIFITSSRVCGSIKLRCYVNNTSFYLSPVTLGVPMSFMPRP